MMEPACQVKGCKLPTTTSNKTKSQKSNNHASDARTNNNNNVGVSSASGSDDDTVDETNNRKNNRKTHHKRNGSPVNHNNNSTTTSNNKNKASSNISNSSSSSSSSNSNSPNKLGDTVTYSKAVSNGLTTNDLTAHSKANGVVTTTTATATIPYNKIVSNGKTTVSSSTTNELVHTKARSNGHTPTMATASTMTCDMPYSKVVSGANNKVNSDSYNNLINSSLSQMSISSNKISSPEINNQVPNENGLAKNKHVSNGNGAIKTKTKGEVQQRRAVLSYEQVNRLDDVMSEVVSIHGRGNFPTLEVRLRDLVSVVKGKLEADPANGGAGMKVRDIRLNGGCASHVLATDAQPYNDLDLIFGVELTNGRNYDKVKAAVLGSLFDLLPEGVSRKRITTCSLKEAYVSKMVKVCNDGDRWSLISLGNSRGHRNVELKFVDTMRRQFEFSVDSFQIVLDSLLCSKVQITETVYPTVVGESVYGDFHEALYHLQKKLISTRHPEEIRGGGLLKYCNLLVKMYKPAQPDYIKILERYMCSRFFIDFPDIGQQRAKLENYLWNHFVGLEEEALKYQYLMLLHSVVEESTVCLMAHERRQTLALIESLAYQVLCQEQQQLTSHQAPPPAYVYANGYYYAPVIPATCYTCTCNSSWMACSS